VKWRSKARPGAREVKGGAVWRSVEWALLSEPWVWLGMVAMV
jgi:hypothetical protein